MTNKNIFLASSFSDVSNLFSQYFKKDLKWKKITFFPTGSLVEEVNFYVNDAKVKLENLWLIIDEINFENLNFEELSNKIKNNDFIYVSWWNTFYLLQEIKNSGIGKIIIDEINKWKIYIWESAGSMILSKNIEYVKMMDDENKATDLKNNIWLWIIDFYPVPHYKNFPFENCVENIIKKYEWELNLVPFSNNQAIIVSWNNYKIINN